MEDEMEFRLTYAGKLLSHRENRQSRSLHVHSIRREFHKQLSVLWKEHPILKRSHAEGSRIPNPETSRQKTTDQDGFSWKPIVRKDNGLMCMLNILMLRVGPPGGVKSDIDNRLKTLFDALRMAHNPQELGQGTDKGMQKPEPDETPFNVLLEDDSLITRVAVNSDMLLEPVDGVKPESAAVRLVISVIIRPYNVTHDNVDFAGS